MQRFQLFERLGNGSYSEVFKALNKATGEECALKIMKYKYDIAKKNQDLEVLTLKMFAQTPTIIGLKETFMAEGQLVLVFQLLQTNLIDHYKAIKTKQDRGLSQPQIKSVMFQTCLALQSLHKQGYAHRDMKPQNILLRHCGQHLLVKLVDFGLTKKLSPGHNTNYIATRWYRSPQLLLNMNYDLSVDVFALGCLMVELYLGFQAFPGSDAIDQLNKIFAILGTPTKETWPEGVRAITDKRIMFPEYDPVSLKDNIPGISDLGLDLLSKMVTNNPKNRLPMDKILQHPYFNGVDSLLPEVVLKYVKQSQHKHQIGQNDRSQSYDKSTADQIFESKVELVMKMPDDYWMKKETADIGSKYQPYKYEPYISKHEPFDYGPIDIPKPQSVKYHLQQQTKSDPVLEHPVIQPLVFPASFSKAQPYTSTTLSGRTNLKQRLNVNFVNYIPKYQPIKITGQPQYTQRITPSISFDKTIDFGQGFLTQRKQTGSMELIKPMQQMARVQKSQELEKNQPVRPVLSFSNNRTPQNRKVQVKQINLNKTATNGTIQFTKKPMMTHRAATDRPSYDVTPRSHSTCKQPSRNSSLEQHKILVHKNQNQVYLTNDFYNPITPQMRQQSYVPSPASTSITPTPAKSQIPSYVTPRNVEAINPQQEALREPGRKLIVRNLDLVSNNARKQKLQLTLKGNRDKLPQQVIQPRAEGNCCQKMFDTDRDEIKVQIRRLRCLNKPK